MRFFLLKKIEFGKGKLIWISLKDLIAKNRYGMRFFKKMNMGRGIIKGFNCLKHV
jgi:hypothetical protein